jgi:hypothetical protein
MQCRLRRERFSTRGLITDETPPWLVDRVLSVGDMRNPVLADMAERMLVEFNRDAKDRRSTEQSWLIRTKEAKSATKD